MAMETSVARGVLGILAGVAAGAVLSVAFLVGPGAILDDITRAFDAGRHFTSGSPLPTRMGDSISLGVWKTAFFWSAIVGAIAVPLWMGLGRLGRSGRIDALWLGALVGAPFGLLFDGNDKLVFAPRLAAVGALAGLVTWFVSHRRQRMREPSSAS
jgi:hypothetical protein